LGFTELLRRWGGAVYYAALNLALSARQQQKAGAKKNPQKNIHPKNYNSKPSTLKKQNLCFRHGEIAGAGETVRLQAMPQRMPSFWRRGMPRSQIQKSMMIPKTKPMTRPSSMSPCVPSDTSSMTRSNRRDPSRITPPPIPMGGPSPWFCSSHSSSSSTDSKSDRGLPPCRREWNCARRRSTSVCENPARRLPSPRPDFQRKPLCATHAGWSRGEGVGWA
jgi:hypothetical protein